MPISQNIVGTSLPIIYSDVNTRFSLNGKSELLTNYDDIKNSILNIMGTLVGTRPWWRPYGSNIPRLLFNPCNEDTAESIRLDIFQSISQWEPRVEMDYHKSFVVPLSNKAGYNANVAYFVPELEFLDTLMVNLTR